MSGGISITVTLFGDMGDEGKMTYHDHDRIYDKRPKARYAMLKESHLFIQYSGKFTAVERRKCGKFRGGNASERLGKLAAENQTGFYWRSR